MQPAAVKEGAHASLPSWECYSSFRMCCKLDDLRSSISLWSFVCSLDGAHVVLGLHSSVMIVHAVGRAGVSVE